jgi:2-keto-4-pentenoate hydratase/2-oxohepta-3-ene-1,7-dioic acid hydratase in catechol pathway
MGFNVATNAKGQTLWKRFSSTGSIYSVGVPVVKCSGRVAKNVDLPLDITGRVNMQLVTYLHHGKASLGVLRSGYVTPMNDLLHTDINDMLALIDMQQATLPVIQQALVAMPEKSSLPIDTVQLVAPIQRPRKNIFCVGRNYAEHAQERGADLPSFPVFFTKAPNTVIGMDAPILHHEVTNQLDYEAELAVIIGKAGRNISRQDALSHVFGYTIINDVTARDLQKQHQQWFKGKSLDNSCPMGPAIITADEIVDPQNLQARLWVNGELRQSASTRDMIFTIPVLIEWLSQGYTLEAGDIIATGTPAGVGAGFTPPRFLHSGDEVVAEISGIGRLRNPVQAADSHIR